MDGKPRVFLDSTPDYLWSPGVAPRIKQMAPNAKFVILMRVCLSVLTTCLPALFCS